MRSILGQWRGLVVAAMLAGAVPAHAGLIASYNFDETGGTTAFDSVGSVNGMLQGGTAFAAGAGIEGGALSLSKATNSFVTMGDNFNFTTDFSIQVWVKLSPGDTESEIPVARHTATIEAGYLIGINDISDGCSANGKAHFYTGYPCSGNSAIPVNDGEWHQLVGTYAAGLSSIYVDGVLQSSVSGAPLSGIGSAFMVGGITASGVPTGVFSGLIDEVRIFDSVLSAGEVAALYESAVPEPDSIGLTVGGVLILVALGLRRLHR